MSRRRRRHTPEQIIRKLRDADAMLAGGETIGEVCQALEVSEPRFHRWRNQYGGMKAEEAKRLKKLEEENRRLKRLLAEAELDKARRGPMARGIDWSTIIVGRTVRWGTRPRRSLPPAGWLVE
jgi:putative transposase